MEGHPPEYNFLIWSSDVTANTFYCLLLCGQLFNKPRLNDKKLFFRLQSNTPHNKKRVSIDKQTTVDSLNKAQGQLAQL